MIYLIYINEKINLRLSKLCDDGTDGLDRNNGKKTRGISTAKQPNTIAKTTLGRVKIDIVWYNIK